MPQTITIEQYNVICSLADDLRLTEEELNNTCKLYIKASIEDLDNYTISYYQANKLIDILSTFNSDEIFHDVEKEEALA